MLKELKKKISDNGRIYETKFNKDEVSFIMDNTSFLVECKFQERCYNVLHDIESMVLCKECKNNKPKFLRISTGYRTFCSCKCKNKYFMENTNIKDKIRKSVKQYSDNLSVVDRREQQNKRLGTLCKRGIITHKDDRNNFYNYTREVWRFTNSNDLSLLSNYDKRGRVEINGTFHLDHKYSVLAGFKENIPPYIIGSIHNLEMIPAIENVSKKEKCSISKEELYKYINI